MKSALAATSAMLLAACQPSERPADPTPSSPVGVPGPASVAPPSATASPAPSTTPVSYFYFGNHVPRAEIVSIEGPDTASAKLTGQTTAQDNYDYCIGYAAPDEAEVRARCADQKVAPPPDVMTANCVDKTVSDGSEAVWVRDEPGEDGKIRPVWRDKASGQIRDYSGAGGGYVLTAAFRILCPAASVNFQPDPR